MIQGEQAAFACAISRNPALGGGLAGAFQAGKKRCEFGLALAASFEYVPRLFTGDFPGGRRP